MLYSEPSMEPLPVVRTMDGSAPWMAMAVFVTGRWFSVAPSMTDTAPVTLTFFCVP